MNTQLSQAAELLSRWDAASTPNELGLHNAGGFAQHNCVEIREAFRGLLTALSTPPADDVREALANMPTHVTTDGTRYGRLGEVAADYYRTVFEVRPRGTVTDALYCAHCQNDDHANSACEARGTATDGEVRPRGTVTDTEALRFGKVAWVAYQDDKSWAESVVEDCFSPADDLPKEALDMIAVARAVLNAAGEDRS